MKRLGAALTIGLIISFTWSTTATNAQASQYVVSEGDNLWKIAKENYTTIDHLIDLNELDSTVIFPEQTLDISETYEVVKGDTLYEIAKEYEITVDDIKEANDLDSNIIVPGQELEIIPKEQSKEKDEKKLAKREATKQAATSDAPKGEKITVTATAYTAECDGCTGTTYTGVNLLNDRNAKVIAVDPDVIPLGSKVYIEGYGYAVAEDIGGSIKGNRIDVHVPTKEEAYDWGVRETELTIIE